MVGLIRHVAIQSRAMTKQDVLHARFARPTEPEGFPGTGRRSLQSLPLCLTVPGAGR
jgi:hypothetical protein